MVESEGIAVDVTANVRGLVDGFDNAANQVDASLNKVTHSADRMANAIGTKTAEAAHKGAHATEYMNVSLTHLGQSSVRLREHFTTMWEAIGAAVATEGIRKVDEMLQEMAKRAVEAKTASEALDMSTRQYQGLAAAAAEVNIPMEHMSRIVEMLQQRMAMAAMEGGETAERFQSMGISMKELQNPAFSVVDAMKKLGAAANSNKAILAVLGARGADLIPIIRQLAHNHQLLADKAKEVNAESDKTINTLARYAAATAVQKDMLENLEGTISAGLMPAMIWLKGEMVSFGYVGKMMVMEVVYAFEMLGDRIGAIGAAIAAAITGHFSQAARILHASLADSHAQWEQMKQEWVHDEHASDNAVTNIEKTFNAKQPANHPGRGNKLVSYMGIEKEHGELQKMVTWAQQFASRTSALVNAGLQKQIAITRQIHAEELSEQESSAKEKLAVTVSGLQRQLAAVQDAYKTHRISATQDYQQTVALLQQKLAAQEQYYARLRALAEGNVPKMHAIAAREAQVTTQYHMQILRTQTSLTEQIQQHWKQMGDRIASSWQGMVGRMLEGTMNFHMMLLATERKIAETLITNQVKVLAHYLMTEVAKQQAARMTAVVQGASAKEGATQSLAHSGMAGIKAILNDAYQAAAGAFKAIVGIPYIGPILAPPAAAAAFAAVAAFQSGVASAAGGWEVPSDQLAMVHKNEMILPAGISRGLKDMIGAGAGSGTTYNITHRGDVNVSSSELKQLLGSPGARDTLMQVIGRAIRNGSKL